MQQISVNILSVFMVLFAVIDILGIIPFLIVYKKQGHNIVPSKITAMVFAILTVSLVGGELVLHLFGIDIGSFAIAGSMVIFFLSLEMTLGISIFKSDPQAETSVVPIAFPLLAGPGSITTLITLRAEYSMWVILAGLALNMVVIYVVLHSLTRLSNILKPSATYFIQKIFGIILMAIAVKIFLKTTGIPLPK